MARRGTAFIAKCLTFVQGQKVPIQSVEGWRAVEKIVIRLALLARQ
jgi:hypothetical protein